MTVVALWHNNKNIKHNKENKKHGDVKFLVGRPAFRQLAESDTLSQFKSTFFAILTSCSAHSKEC